MLPVSADTCVSLSACVGVGACVSGDVYVGVSVRTGIPGVFIDVCICAFIFIFVYMHACCLSLRVAFVTHASVPYSHHDHPPSFGTTLS